MGAIGFAMSLTLPSSATSETLGKGECMRDNNQEKGRLEKSGLLPFLLLPNILRIESSND